MIQGPASLFEDSRQTICGDSLATWDLYIHHCTHTYKSIGLSVPMAPSNALVTPNNISFVAKHILEYNLDLESAC